MESRKKGVAITAITALVAMKPASKTELAIAGCVTVIALAAIGVQTYLDRKGEKHENEADNTDVPANG